MSEISKEAVAGVWPIELGEAPIMEVWPSMATFALGRVLGRLYGLPIPLGLLFGILTLPLALVLWAMTLWRRYTLTTLRVVIRTGPSGKEGPQLLLSDLEDARIVERPGQSFYRAADLELIAGGRVALTLAGVPNPEAFRHNILAARDALIQVRSYRQAQEPAAVESIR